MPDPIAALRALVETSSAAQAALGKILASAILATATDASEDLLPIEDYIDPLDRERIVQEGLSDLSDSLGLRYVQVCRDLRESQRLAWTSDAHELRDILATVLRNLAPNDEVTSKQGYVQVAGTSGPTHAQRVQFILSQSRSTDEVRQGLDQLTLIDELISRIVRYTYTAGSSLAHTSASRQDCILLLFQFDALMVSLLNVEFE